LPLVGKGRALQLILSGEMISAQEAYSHRVVNEVVPAADLIGTRRSDSEADHIQRPIAIKLALRCRNKGLETSQSEGFALEASYFGICAATEDKKEARRPSSKSALHNFTDDERAGSQTTRKKFNMTTNNIFSD